MQKLARIFLCVVFGLAGFSANSSWAGAHEQQSEPVINTAELLQYTRLYTGDDNETHFEDVPVTFEYKDYGKNIPTVWFL